MSDSGCSVHEPDDNAAVLWLRKAAAQNEQSIRINRASADYSFRTWYVERIDERKTISAVAILQDDAMGNQTRRYAVRQEVDSSWAVYDVFTGMSAKPSTWKLEGLPEQEARVFCAILNEKDAARRVINDRR